MALSSANMSQPRWKQAQQKQGETKSRKQAVQGSSDKNSKDLVKVRMTSDYRDVARKGQVYETDAEKADELIRLGRAVAFKK